MIITHGTRAAALRAALTYQNRERENKEKYDQIQKMGWNKQRNGQLLWSATSSIPWEREARTVCSITILY